MSAITETVAGQPSQGVSTPDQSKRVTDLVGAADIESRPVPGQHYSQRYHGSKAWWSVGELQHQGITHQSVGLSLGRNGEEETWDLSDSLADLYQAVTRREQRAASRHKSQATAAGGSVRVDTDKSQDIQRWLDDDTSHGFIRVFQSDLDSAGRIFPCTLSTPAQKICLQLGIPGNALHVQLSGDIIKRMESIDCPLAIQNEYLSGLGYSDIKYIQEAGPKEDLSFLVRFYAGKPLALTEHTYSRNQLTTYAYIRKGKLLHQWFRRRCTVSGTRMLIYRENRQEPTVVQLARGSVEEVTYKGQSLVLKITTSQPTERSMYMSFSSQEDYTKWLRKLRKATSKLPDKVDLSNCHLEYLPDNVFINAELKILILRHNALRERPIEEDIYTIGWLDDLPRFSSLRVLNLADNQLMAFPASLCQMKSLVELNLSSNRLNEVPPEISELSCLKVMHLHNNCLTTIPDEIADMKSLCHIVLAFNQFSQIPAILLQSKMATFLVDSIIMAGNQISRLPADQFVHMTKIKKIDLRLNQLQLMPTETAKFQSLEHVTHLDVRENQITDLDIRAIKCLESLYCDHNKTRTMQLNGSQLKNVFAAHNCLQTLSINPKPEYLAILNVSHNKLTELPGWLADCFFLIHLDVSHNLLKHLPDRLLTDAKRLKILKANHNQLTELPDKIQNDTLEELHLQQNHIRHLSSELFIKAHRLRYLNMTKNKLTDLPAPNKNDSYNKLQELYLSFNHLANQCLYKICCFPRLRVLHLAKNKISVIEEVDIEKLEQLTELNVSSNNLTYLPSAIGRHPKLQVLRANCNLLRELPSLKSSSGLKVLEVSSNHLIKVKMDNLLSSHITVLDITANPTIQMKSKDLEMAKNKKLHMVDVRGQNLTLDNLGLQTELSSDQLWRSGLSTTSGIRNKLSVSTVNKPHLNDNGEALFAIFDGGRNDGVTSQLCDIIPAVLKEERLRSKKPEVYLKYSLLSAHRNLKGLGQKLGAAAVVSHIHKDEKDNYILSVANVGDSQVVLCRQKKCMLLSRLFLVAEDMEDTKRVVKAGGYITEDGRVSGVTNNTRLLGCNYLYPQVIPEPHVSSTVLTNDDTLCIMANQGLWQYVTYEEAVQEIKDTPDPVVAAKRLQDLAQGYGSRENIAVLVVRLMLSEGERTRITDLMRIQRKSEKELLKALNQPKDILHFRDGVPRGEELNGIIIDRSGHAKKHRSGRKHLLDSDSIHTYPSAEEVTEKFLPQKEYPDSLISQDAKAIMENISHMETSHMDNSHIVSQEPESLSHPGERRLYRKKSHGLSHPKKESPQASTEDIARIPASYSDAQLAALDSVDTIYPHGEVSESVHSGTVEDDSIGDDSSNGWPQLSPSLDSDYIIPYDEFNDDPFNRFSSNVSPTESVTSINTAVHDEIEEIYKSRHEILLSKNAVNTWRSYQNFDEANLDFRRRPLSPDSLISQDEFIKPMVSMTNIDRDAILFHQMQLARSQAHSGSIASLDSIQSAPLRASKHDIYPSAKVSSHSIEVLVNIGENNNDSLTGGRVEWGSSFSGLQTGNSTVNSSKIVNMGSGSDVNSFLMESFLDSSLQHSQSKDHGISGVAENDNSDDADTLVGGDNDIGNLNDVLSDEEMQGREVKADMYNDVAVVLATADDRLSIADSERSQHMSGGQEPIDEDSDSDDSIGNVSLEDGYLAMEFPVSNKKESLSMLNIVDIESEKYLQNFSKLKSVHRHGKSKLLDTSPEKSQLYSSKNSMRSLRMTKDKDSESTTDSVKIRSFNNLTYAEIHLNETSQNFNDPHGMPGEKDFDDLYAVVNKMKKNKLKEKRKPETSELDDDLFPMLYPVTKNPEIPQYDVEDILEGTRGPSGNHSPALAHKAGLRQSKKSPPLIREPPESGRQLPNRTPSIPKRTSITTPDDSMSKFSSTSSFKCNTQQADENDWSHSLSFTHPSLDKHDSSEISFPRTLTNPPVLSEDPNPPPIPPRPSHFTPMADIIPLEAPRKNPLSPKVARPPPIPARRHGTPPLNRATPPIATPRRSLSKKAVNVKYEIDNTVLSAQDLYQDSLQQNSPYSSSIDVSNDASKLSHQRSIIITYL